LNLNLANQRGGHQHQDWWHQWESWVKPVRSLVPWTPWMLLSGSRCDLWCDEGGMAWWYRKKLGKKVGKRKRYTGNQVKQQKNEHKVCFLWLGETRKVGQANNNLQRTNEEKQKWVV
jgi:hypothetical protein